MKADKHTAVLARIERIQPQANGGGVEEYRGVVHVFNGADVWNKTGQLRAWCGAVAASVDLQAIYDRGHRPGALYANVCRRCFVEPRAKVVHPDAYPVYKRACTNCSEPYETTLPEEVFTKSPAKDLCGDCTQHRLRLAKERRHG